MVTFESYEWQSAGVEPADPADAIYTAGEQPVAGYDNHWNWAVSNDLAALRDHTTAHGSEHEAGGVQEIDLENLSVGGEGTLTTSSDTVALSGSDGNTVLRYHNLASRISDLAPVANGLESVHTFSVGGNIETLAGDVLYDAGTDYFHRAETALTAAEADHADDATTLDGTPLSEFLFADADETLTGKWSSQQSIDTDIDGHASTASRASEADHATDADNALQADNAALHESKTVQEIVDLATDSVDEVDVGKVGQGDIVTDAEAVYGGTSVDVAEYQAGVARLDVNRVPEADFADDANDSSLHDGYTVDEIITLAQQSDGEWDHLDTITETTLGTSGVTYNVPAGYDILKLLVVNEPHTEWQWNDIYMRVNGESRDRYHVLRRQYWKDDSYFSSQPEGKDFYRTVQDYFMLCKTDNDRTAMAEYTLAIPPTISGEGTSYITKHMTSEWITPNVGQNEIRGQIEAAHSSIDTLHFFIGGAGSRGESSFHCVIYGRTIPQP